MTDLRFRYVLSSVGDFSARLEALDGETAGWAATREVELSDIAYSLLPQLMSCGTPVELLDKLGVSGLLLAAQIVSMGPDLTATVDAFVERVREDGRRVRIRAFDRKTFEAN